MLAMEDWPMARVPHESRPAGKAPAKWTGKGSSGTLRALAHFRILRLIGLGGMSEVYLAYDPKTRRQVAIKVLADHLVTNQSFVNRFLQEGRLGRDLTHPNIVKAYVFGQDPASKKHFIVMELVDGPTAQERLEKGGRLPLADATRLIVDIARGLEYLHHQRYVHRDIKPGNILIAPDGSAKLADLGVAKFLDNSQSLTTLDQGVGTPYYMPWEQGINSCLVDPRSDVFALGATFYHLLTGRVPFPGENETIIAKRKEAGRYRSARHYVPSLPQGIDTLFARMLARDPRKRFTSAGEVVEVLSAAGLTHSSGSFAIDVEENVPQPLAPTRADLKAQVEVDTPLDDNEQIWILKYKRIDDGSWRKLRGRTNEVIRLFEAGVLPDEVYAAREPAQVFRRLRAYPEFRKLARASKTAQSSKKRGNPLRDGKPISSRGWQWCQNLSGLMVAGIITLACCSTASSVLQLIAAQQ
jgi:eukaryotic-like serine/threonine-protein kinase